MAAHQLGETRSIYYSPQAPQEYHIELAAHHTGLLWLLPPLAFGGFGGLVIRVGRS